MQNQQTQQNPQNGTQLFFHMEQGPDNFDPYQIGTENKNTATRQGSGISSQIGEAAIGGAAIDRAATGATQVESSIPAGAQEPLDIQAPPNDDATRESISNSEVSGVKPEATNIIPSPFPESQAQNNEQKTKRTSKRPD